VVYTPLPVSSAPAYTPVPVSSAPAYTPVPVASSSKEAQPSIQDYVPAPVSSAPASSKEAQPSKQDYVPVPVSFAPAYSAPAYTPSPAASSKAVPKPKPSKAPQTSYSNGGRIVTNGNKWAITYTPYASNGDCKSYEEVKHDISKIAAMGFTTIRSYSTDCGVFEHVVPECQKHGLKVIYGIFLEAGGKGGKGPFSDYANNQLQEIIENAPKDSVAMVIVGNEALFNNYCTPEELGSYIDYVREQLRAADFPSDIAVTTTETVDVWEQKGAALCAHIDVFAVQVHPFFTSKVSASEAGDFVKEQLEQAAKVCPEVAAKGKYVSETGWPKEGQSNGNAHPGAREQKEAIRSIMEKVGSEACIFSYQDDMWKAPGALGVEQSFGCSEAIEAAA
jgi:exo-beta-1,3-glucanase (GH17 family)